MIYLFEFRLPWHYSTFRGGPEDTLYLKRECCATPDSMYLITPPLIRRIFNTWLSSDLHQGERLHDMDFNDMFQEALDTECEHWGLSSAVVMQKCLVDLLRPTPEEMEEQRAIRKQGKKQRARQSRRSVQVKPLVMRHGGGAEALAIDVSRDYTTTSVPSAETSTPTTSFTMSEVMGLKQGVRQVHECHVEESVSREGKARRKSCTISSVFLNAQESTSPCSVFTSRKRQRICSDASSMSSHMNESLTE